MTTASCPLATALWAARFAGVWRPSCYTTWGGTDPGRSASLVALVRRGRRRRCGGLKAGYAAGQVQFLG